MIRYSRHALVAVLTVWLSLPASAVAAQDDNPPPAPPAPAPKTVLLEVLKDLRALPSVQTATILGIGGGGALAIHPADANLNQQVSGSDYRFLTPGRFLGGAAVHLGGAAGAYLVGYRVGGRDSAAARVGAELLRAQLLTQGLTHALKAAVRRKRPDESDHFSFPSGHASSTFASATVLASHFGWRVTVPAYLVATYVAASRMHENRHNASDVVFGAALGIAVGRNVRFKRNVAAAAPAVQLVVLGGVPGVHIEW